MKMDDDGDDKDDTKRRTRNLSEKKRRDQFNMLVHELSTMVSTNSRKMDKSTVLKATISFLKNHNEITVRSRAHDVHEDWKPAFLSNEEFTYLMLEALEGFVMVFSSTGRIYYVSESITSLLGHNPANVVNQSIFDYACEEDRPNLYNLLQRNIAGTENIQSVCKDKEMVMFDMHFRRNTLDFRDEITYEVVSFNGHFRTNGPQTEDDTDMGFHQEMNSSYLFVCTGRLQTPLLVRDVSLIDPSRNEFTSRHSLEWKFLFLDHRAPPIIGYLPFEVLGTSGYDYYHFDDLEKVVTCHEELMQKGELTSCYYRFLTKGQQWIWLQTRFYITYHQWNSKPEFVVCTHRVVSYTDIIKMTKEGNTGANSMIKVDVSKIKPTPSEEAAMSSISPSYMSETTDVFGGSYRTHSPVNSTSQRAEKNVQSDDATAPVSPSYMSEASEACSFTFRSQGNKQNKMIESGQSDDAGMAPVSPSYVSEASDNFGTSYRTQSRPASLKSVSSAANASWRRSRHRYSAPSDGSVSGESRGSARHAPREKKSQQVVRYERCDAMPQQPGKAGECALAPQHGIGAQYLDPVPYVNAVGVPAVLPLSLRSVPVIVSQDQAQIQLLWQEQLQRKHEELQQMIVRQQEELQQVKEQLLLARLGILQPVINVPYANPDQLQQQQLVNPMQPQITYETSRGGVPFPSPHPQHQTHPPGPQHQTHPPGPQHPTHQPGPQHPTHPPGPQHQTHQPGPQQPTHPPGPQHQPHPPGPQHQPHPPGPQHQSHPPGPHHRMS